MLHCMYWCFRKELANVWESHAQAQEHTAQQANLIRQLKALQADTQASKCR